jgi:hypothetical protein
MTDEVPLKFTETMAEYLVRERANLSFAFEIMREPESYRPRVVDWALLTIDLAEARDWHARRLGHKPFLGTPKP